jgi:predicted ATPase
MKTKTFLRSVRIENFKAIQDSKTVSLTPLTVFIGNNGSGKSSLIEGLETYRTIVVEGLDTAISRWFGFEHIWHKNARHNLVLDHYENPMKFSWAGGVDGAMQGRMVITTLPKYSAQLIQEETARCARRWNLERSGDGRYSVSWPDQPKQWNITDPGKTALPLEASDFVAGWQFISLSPDKMGTPAPKRVTPTKNLLLNRDGSNLAQYLANIRDKDVHAFNGIVDAMRFVLDYATDLQPIETSEVQRTMYVSMKEREYDIPGWMLSTGTVRILGLLAVLRNPEPPPVVIVEEIENGLDPRTIHMVLDEIRMAVQSGRTQVILTTHSPYFLNLLPLQTIVLVERDGGGNPVFWRPSDEGEVKEWGKRFAPGELYTAGRFRRG